MNAVPSLRYVVEGPTRRVAMLANVVREFEKLEARVKSALQRQMHNYAHDHRLPDTQYKLEERVDVGHGTRIGIWAFKSRHVRVYGAEVPLGGATVFICSEIDTAKKRQKANPGYIQRAARNIQAVLES
jgi:hypothetical protein